MYFSEVLKEWILKYLSFNKMMANKINKKAKENILFHTGMERTVKTELLPFNREVECDSPGKMYLVFAFSLSVFLFHADRWRP